MSILNFKYEKKSETAEQPAKKRKKEEIDTKGKTENFFTNHVKLITFLICLGVFLAIFGPISVFRIRDYIEEKRAIANAMTVQDILELAEDRDQLYLSDFEDFTKDMAAESFYIIKVEPSYLVTVRSDSANGKLSYFVVKNIATEQTVDIMAANYSPDALRALLGQ